MHLPILACIRAKIDAHRNDRILQDSSRNQWRTVKTSIKTTTPYEHCKIIKLILHIPSLTTLGFNHRQLPNAHQRHQHHHPPSLSTTTTTTTTTTHHVSKHDCHTKRHHHNATTRHPHTTPCHDPNAQCDDANKTTTTGRQLGKHNGTHIEKPEEGQENTGRATVGCTRYAYFYFLLIVFY